MDNFLVRNLIGAIFLACWGPGGCIFMALAAQKTLETTDYLLAFFIPFYGLVVGLSG